MKILIFAGGNGTRLWPVSRVKTPKQFQNLLGNKSLFEMTVDRITKRYSLDDIYIVIPEIYLESVNKLRGDIDRDHIIIEPAKWDTLACIGYASFILNKKFPDENLFFSWSDHIIQDEEKFLDIIDEGNKYALKHNKIIRIGAKAVYPQINLGYLKFGDEIESNNNVKIYSYEQHYEKPEFEIAKKFVNSFEYLWNTGYMIWPSKKIIEAYKEYSPLTYEILNNITNDNFKGNLKEEFRKINKKSMDYEILEQAKKEDFVVIPADVGWNDVGDWASLKSQLEGRTSDNVKIGNFQDLFEINTENTLIYSDNLKKTICVIGLRDIAIIDTKDALLVCSKSKSRDVKKIVEMLKEVNSPLT